MWSSRSHALGTHCLLDCRQLRSAGRRAPRPVIIHPCVRWTLRLLYQLQLICCGALPELAAVTSHLRVNQTIKHVAHGKAKAVLLCTLLVAAYLCLRDVAAAVLLPCEQTPCNRQVAFQRLITSKLKSLIVCSPCPWLRRRETNQLRGGGRAGCG
jgi:hypothetical protein